MSFEPYNITIPDNSPTWSYQPYRDGLANGGWNLTYSGSSDASWVEQTQGTGTSSHVARHAGSTASITFTGTAYWIYGTANASTYTTTLDNQSPVTGSGGQGVHLLASQTNLAYKSHTVTLNTTSDIQVSLLGATLQVGVGEPKSNPQNTSISATYPDNNGNIYPASQFTTSGLWYEPSVSGSTTYPRLSTQGYNAAAQITLNQTSAFILYGTGNFDHGMYQVTVTPSSGSAVTTQYNGSSHWIALDQVLHFSTGLDRDLTYTVQLTDLDQNSLYVDLNHIVTIDGVPSSSNSPGLSSGKIAGIVVAVVLVVLIGLGVGGFFWWRRRKASKRRGGAVEPFDIDNDVDYAATRGGKRRVGGGSDLAARGSFYRHLPSDGNPSEIEQDAASVTPFTQPAITDPAMTAPSGFSVTNPTPSDPAFSEPGSLPLIPIGPNAKRSNNSHHQQQPRLRQEADAGRVPETAATEEVIPPSYEARWANE